MTKHIVRRILAASGCLFAMSVSAETLLVHLTGLEHDGGMVRCGLYDDSNGWREEDRAMQVAMGAIQRGTAVCDFGEVAPGVYAIAAYHAEHADDRLRLSFLGRPEQAVGFSMNPSRLFGAPKFDAAMFHMGNEPRLLTIEMR